MRFPRASYVPKGQSNKIASKKSSAVVYLSLSALGRFYAVGFYGKADKPSFNYSFRTADARVKYVAKWLQDMDANAAYKADQAAKKKAALSKPHGLKVNDVLVSSWGYDQTNIDYYQVVELVGQRSVKIRAIQCESVDTCFMQGKSVPAVDNFSGEPMLKKVSENDSVRIASYASARKLEQVVIDGVSIGYKPSHWTAYA